MNTRYISIFFCFFSSFCFAQNTPKTLMAQSSNAFEYIGKLGDKTVTISIEKVRSNTSEIKVYFGDDKIPFQSNVTIPVKEYLDYAKIRFHNINDTTLLIDTDVFEGCDISTTRFFVVQANGNVYKKSKINNQSLVFIGASPKKIYFKDKNFYQTKIIEYDFTTKLDVVKDYDNFFNVSCIINDTLLLGFTKNIFGCKNSVLNPVSLPAYIANNLATASQPFKVVPVSSDIIYIVQLVNNEYRTYWFSTKNQQFLGYLDGDSFGINYTVKGNLIVATKHNFQNDQFYVYEMNNKGLMKQKVSYGNQTDVNFFINDALPIADKYMLVGYFKNNCSNSPNDAYVLVDSTVNIQKSDLNLNVQVSYPAPPIYENKKYRFPKLVYTFKNLSDSTINNFYIKSFNSNGNPFCSFGSVNLSEVTGKNLLKNETRVDTIYNAIVSSLYAGQNKNQLTYYSTAVNNVIDNSAFSTCYVMYYPRSSLEVSTQDAENQQFTKVFIAENSIKVSCEKAEYFPITLRLFDINGRLLKTSTFENNDDAIELPQGLSSGMYIANLKCSDGVQFAKKLMFVK